VPAPAYHHCPLLSPAVGKARPSLGWWAGPVGRFRGVPPALARSRLSRSGPEASWSPSGRLGHLGRFLAHKRPLSREEIGSSMRAPVGQKGFDNVFPEQMLPTANSARRPMERSFDDSNIPSTIVPRWNFLSLSWALSTEGAFSRVVASVALSWRFGIARTIGRIELLRLRFCPRNRVLGFSFSVSIGLLQSVR